MSTSELVTKTVDMKWESKCISLSCKNVGYREIGRYCPVCHAAAVAEAAAMREAVAPAREAAMKAEAAAVEKAEADHMVLYGRPLGTQPAPVARRDDGYCIRCDGPLSYDPTGRGICDECRA